MPSSDLPDVSQWLVYEPRFLDPGLPTGLWFCDSPATVLGVEINACCLAAGADWDDLGRCEAFAQAFPYVLIVCPDSARRGEMVEQVRMRWDTVPLLVAEDKAFRGCRTIQALRETYGLKAVERILLDVRELPAYGLLELADVVAPDIAGMETVLSGLAPLDAKIGGFHMGELSVWTGKRGDGKSTLLGQLLLESVDQGKAVCAYSGELPDWQFQYWIHLQAAGPDHLVFQTDKRTGKRLPAVPPPVQDRINDWFRRRFLLYDIGSSAVHDAERILRLFQYAHRVYNAKTFLVDNIMTARLKTERYTDFYRAQSDFVSALSSFAKSNNVHVHLVAHPRKTGNALEADDVSGIGDITNFADNVFALTRDAKTLKNGRECSVEASLSILKNRFFGARCESGIALHFDPVSRRFFRTEDKKNKKFAWEFCGTQVALTELTEPDPAMPF